MATLLLIHPFLGALQPELLTTMQVFGLMQWCSHVGTIQKPYGRCKWGGHVWVKMTQIFYCIHVHNIIATHTLPGSNSYSRKTLCTGQISLTVSPMNMKIGGCRVFIESQGLVDEFYVNTATIPCEHSYQFSYANHANVRSLVMQVVIHVCGPPSFFR